MISIKGLQKLDIRLGKVIDVEVLKNTKYTTHKLTIDFGKEIGIKTSGARLVNYKKEDLMNKLIFGVINLEPKQISNFMSQVLVLGVPDGKGECILAVPEKEVELGAKLY